MQNKLHIDWYLRLKLLNSLINNFLGWGYLFFSKWRLLRIRFITQKLQKEKSTNSKSSVNIFFIIKSEEKIAQMINENPYKWYYTIFIFVELNRYSIVETEYSKLQSAIIHWTVSELTVLLVVLVEGKSTRYLQENENNSCRGIKTFRKQ